jgi:WD40 repeat protein
MKHKTLLSSSMLLCFIFLLTACNGQISIEPTATIAPTSTDTPITSPAFTPTTAPTLPPTNPPITQTPLVQIQATEYIKFDFSKLDGVWRVVISPDGKKLAASNLNGVWLYDIKTRSLIWEINHTEETPPTGYTFFPIAWSPDSNTLASGLNNQINLWDVSSKKQIGQLTLKNAYAANLAWSHDGNLLASTNLFRNDGEHWKMNVWDLNAQESIMETPIDDNYDWNIDFSPNNSFIALSGIQKHGVRIWEIESGKEHILSDSQLNKQEGFQNVAWHTNSSFPSPAYGGCTGTNGVKWSPDGKSLITVDGCSGILTVWDMELNQKKYFLERAKWFGAWSPDGKYFVYDEYSLNNIHVYSSQSGEPYVDLYCSIEVPTPEMPTPMDFGGDMIWFSDNNKLLAVSRTGELCSWVIP